MSGLISFRFAAESEQATLEALQRRASMANPNDRDAMLAHPDAIQLPREQIAAGRVILAERDGTVVGFAVVLPRPDGGAELDGLFVDPACWRSGVGRRLVDQAAAMARAEGAGALHVIGNPHALGFYQACGFVATGQCATRFGPGITLLRELRA